MSEIPVIVDFTREQLRIFEKESFIPMTAIDIFMCYYSDVDAMSILAEDLRDIMQVAVRRSRDKDKDSFICKVTWKKELVDALVKSGNFERVSEAGEPTKLRFLWNRNG